MIVSKSYIWGEKENEEEKKIEIKEKYERK